MSTQMSLFNDRKEFGYSYVTWREGDRVCEFHEWPWCTDFAWAWWQARDIHAEYHAQD